jgi:hypothetical protein
MFLLYSNHDDIKAKVLSMREESRIIRYQVSMHRCIGNKFGVLLAVHTY